MFDWIIQVTVVTLLSMFYYITQKRYKQIILSNYLPRCTMFLLFVAFLFSESCAPTNTIPKNPPTVVIIGGGASGLATGKRLLELGITPIIIEKESELGGAGAHAGRFFASATSWQRDADISDSISLALSEWQTITGREPNTTIAEFITDTEETLRWIESFGSKFTDVEFDIGAGSVPRIHHLSSEYPHPIEILSEELSPYAKTNTAVLSIEKFDQNFIIHTNNNDIFANIIVIASGGFARNTELVGEFTPNINNYNWHTEAWYGMLGDSIHFFRSLDIPLQNMQHVGLYAHSVTDALLGYPEVMVVPALERSLIVNSQGLRIGNEQYTQSLHGGQLYLEQGPLYAIFDSTLWDGTIMQGMGYNYPTPPQISAVEYARLMPITSSNDIQDLALYSNITPSTFIETIERYNSGFIDNTDEFAKNLQRTHPIQTPPFYALPLVLSTGKSFGGAAIEEYRTIQDNIYVVGEAGGFLGTENVGWGFSGSISACYYMGKHVAETIYQNNYAETH